MQKLCLALDDGHPGLKVRRLHVGGQAPLKTGAQPLFQALDLLGRAVGGDDDLLVYVVQGVEGMEELLLGGLLAGDELDIVHQQQVGGPYFMRKSSVLPARMAGDQLVGELLAGDVHDDKVRMGALDLGLDRGQQVGLAQAGPAVDEQGVIGSGRVGRHSLGCRKGKLVGRAFDEVLESELVIALGEEGLGLVLLGQQHLVGRGAGHTG